MPVLNQQSAVLTALAQTPPIPPAAGSGSIYDARSQFGFVPVAASTDATSVIRFLRVPTTIKIKDVVLESEAMGGAGAVDIGVYYSSSANDSPQAARLAGAVVDADFFASAVAVASAVKSDVTNESGNYNMSLRNQPLWQAVGLASDPGGWFDIAATVTTNLVNAARMGALVRFAE